MKDASTTQAQSQRQTAIETLKGLPRLGPIIGFARAVRYRARERVCDVLERNVRPPESVSIAGARYKLLFVCRGNICRSPVAEATLRARLAACDLGGRVAVDSAGTDVGRPGRRPDPRSRRATLRRGVAIGNLRARRLEPDDLALFDRIVVFDRLNLRDVEKMAQEHGLCVAPELLLSDSEREIADPVAGGPAEFERMLDDIEQGCTRLVEVLKEATDLKPNRG
jgi:protein-tyrosine phosphatase